MTISNGDWSVLVTQPLSATLLALAAVALLGPMVWRMARR
jgi:putative tricarboxylic transport membrane protein